MFSTRGSEFLLIIRLTMLFEYNYLISPVEAVNGVIWSKNEGDFVQIFSIQPFAKMNKRHFLISREVETHDFNGTQLKLTSFPIENLVNFISNDTEVTGVHGDMWQIIAKMSNFKIHSIKIDQYEYGTESENGSWDGLMGYIYRKETHIVPRSVINPSRLTALDFTFATWMTTYRFYMKKQLQFHRTWMAELFTRKLWFSVIGIFFVLTLSSFSIHVLNFKVGKTRNCVSNLRDHFFLIFSIFCNQGWIPQQLEKRAKILILSTRLFAWLLVIAFSSKLISHIAQKKFRGPFNDLKAFYNNTDYKLVVKANSFIYSVFQTSREPIYKTIINSGRLIQSDTSGAYEKTCSGRYVYLESQDVVEAKNSTLCEVTPFGEPYLNTWIAGGVVRGFKYRKTIDLWMMKLHQFGIMDRLKSKWLKQTKTMTISQAFESIRLEHVSLIFAMLGFAVLLSLLILLIENIVYLGLSQDGRRR